MKPSSHILHPIPERRITHEPPRRPVIFSVFVKISRAMFAVPLSTIILVNGILSGGPTDWNEEAAKWIAANTEYAATAYSYWTGIFLSGQDSHADALAKEIITTRATGGKVHVIAHSNGCDLVAMALQRNPEARVDDAFLLAAADYDDCGSGWWKNGLNALIAGGQIARAILGVSAGDETLGSTWMLPQWWGRTLGRDGPTNAAGLPWSCQFPAITPSPGDRPPPNIIIGRNDTYGHTDWVDGAGGFNQATIQTILDFEKASA